MTEQSGEFAPHDPRAMRCCRGNGHPPTWRRIEVDPCHDQALQASRFLVAVGAADEVYPSYQVPIPAVWSLNGVPILPTDSGSSDLPNKEPRP